MQPPNPPLIIACGALSHEIVALKDYHQWQSLKIQCLPAELHNRPDKIPEKISEAIKKARAKGFNNIYVAYGDCGTGGRLDRLLEKENIPRLPGAHCYEFFMGINQFSSIAEQEIGTFYLTDFLARHFDRLIIKGLWLDTNPELLPLYFGHYTRLLYLAQKEDDQLQALARSAAKRLGLKYDYQFTGYGDMNTHMISWLDQPSKKETP